MNKLTPCLWFDTQAEEAAAFYVALFADAELGGVSRYTDAGPGPAGSVQTVSWRLGDTEFVGINGGPVFQFTPAISFQIACENQDEVDHYWTSLTADGGEEGQCGWLTDRFGVSWQVVPTVLPRLLADPDPEKVRRVTEVMLPMKKLVIADLERAAEA